MTHSITATSNKKLGKLGETIHDLEITRDFVLIGFTSISHGFAPITNARKIMIKRIIQLALCYWALELRLTMLSHQYTPQE